VGQYTRFAGIEGVPEENAHFCGEHTSIDSQGYLNGAVETGERVAKEITADLRV
jgi:monoamine oxidase